MEIRKHVERVLLYFLRSHLAYLEKSFSDVQHEAQTTEMSMREEVTALKNQIKMERQTFDERVEGVKTELIAEIAVVRHNTLLLSEAKHGSSIFDPRSRQAVEASLRAKGLLT